MSITVPCLHTSAWQVVEGCQLSGEASFDNRLGISYRKIKHSSRDKTFKLQ